MQPIERTSEGHDVCKPLDAVHKLRMQGRPVADHPAAWMDCKFRGREGHRDSGKQEQPGHYHGDAACVVQDQVQTGCGRNPRSCQGGASTRTYKFSKVSTSATARAMRSPARKSISRAGANGSRRE